VGALSAPDVDMPETAALRLLLEASVLRDDQTQSPLRWCRRFHALDISEGFSSGLQAMIPDWLDPARRRALTDALLAADADTAAIGHVGGALLRQDGYAFLLSDPDGSDPSRIIPGYVHAAFAALPAEEHTGLCDPRLSTHERLTRADALYFSPLRPRPGPGPQRFLYVRTQKHILLLEDRPDSALPRTLGLHR